MQTQSIRRGLTVGAILALSAIPAFSSGFSIYEQDAKASAMAGAFVARADNAAANWYNPAALVRQVSSLQVGVNAITVGQDTTLTINEPFLGFPAGTAFEPEGDTVFPAHLYYTRPAGKKLAWGFGINTPFGLLTEWTPPISLVAKKSELVTIVFNPNFAYAINDYWSIGFGIDYMFADVKNFSRDLADGRTENLSGDGDDWGANIALLYHSEDYKFGFSYRTGLSPNIDGALTINGTSLPGKTTLDLPDQAAIGFAYTAPSKWDIELDISWARWSRFKELRIEIEGAGVRTITEDWDDTFAARLGGSWSFTDRHQLRYGVLVDQNPIPDEWLRPSIPDSDRTSLTAGYGFSGSKIDLDVYYMALFFDDRTTLGNASDPSVLAATYESFSHLLGVTFGWRFGGGS